MPKIKDLLIGLGLFWFFCYSLLYGMAYSPPSRSSLFAPTPPQTVDIESSISIYEAINYYLEQYSPTLGSELEMNLRKRVVTESLVRHSDFRAWIRDVELSMYKNAPMSAEAHAFIFDLMGYAAGDMVVTEQELWRRRIAEKDRSLIALRQELESSERKARINAWANVATAVGTAAATGVVTALMMKLR